MDPQTTYQAKPINLIRGPRRMDTVYTSRRADLVAAGLLLIGAAGIKALLTAPGSLMRGRGRRLR